MLDDLGLIPALEWHFQRFHKQTSIQVNFQHTPFPERLASHIETALFRIVQEALTNVARHANVKSVAVRLWLKDDQVGLQIRDGGRGFDAAKAQAARSSSGLAGMRERAELLGGRFILESSPTGTCLTVELPVDSSLPLLRQ
jgi:signal transduction histidine kinase